MSIKILPAIKRYLECGQFIGNRDIRNVTVRSRFKDILRNLLFLSKSDKGEKVKSLINYFNQSFSNSV